MSDNNEENDNHFDKNQSDNLLQKKKKNISFVWHSLLYGLIYGLIGCLFFYSFNKLKNYQNKKIFVITKMAGNGEFKYDSLVLINEDNVLAIGGGCSDSKAEIYSILLDTFKRISSPNFTHSVLRNV